MVTLTLTHVPPRTEPLSDLLAAIAEAATRHLHAQTSVHEGEQRIEILASPEQVRGFARVWLDQHGITWVVTSTMTVTVHQRNALTANQRVHHMVRAQRTRVLRHTASIAVQAQAVPRMERAHLTVHVSWPTRHRRDVHNLMPTVKALVDGAVSGPGGTNVWAHGVLPDDDDKHLVGPDLRVTDELSGIAGVIRLRFEWEAIS